MPAKTLVVIGGGAAGFFCAVNAARLNPQLKVTIVEKSGKLLSKVKVSGGGRCNITHAGEDISEISKQYPRGQNFIKKCFHQFFTTDTVKWFEERGVQLKTETDGRMFPVTDSSQTVIDCLVKEANKYGIEILMNTEVVKIAMKDSRWRLSSATRDLPIADYICIASGGYPKSSMFEWIKQSGHSVEEPVPSLFTFNMPGHPITKLMGVSVDHAVIKINDMKLQAEGPLLITHWGLSGPAVLRLSAWGAIELQKKNWEFGIRINWLAGFNEQTLPEKFKEFRNKSGAQKLSGKNPFGLPKRLWEFLLQQSGIGEELRWAELPAGQQNKLITALCAYEATIKGKTTFKEEFVTAGGIKLEEIDPNTMMSKKIENLFFAGEIMNVDGITGGYNFQHAWTSGFIAAKAIAALSR